MRTLSLTFLCSAFFFGANAAVFAQEDAQEDEFVTFEEFDEAMEELDSLRLSLDQIRPGDTNFLMSGFFTGGYNDAPDGDSTFSATFSPVFLWTLGEKIFFEGELDFGSNGEVGLDFAQISFLATDYLTLGAGQFLSPFGIFSERIHPSWINKLPNAPLVAGHGGLSPSSILGMQARGAAHVAGSKINYAFFVGNGPQLNNGLAEEDEAGLLHWDNGPDVDNNKSIGGRFGFLPVAGVEIGTSFLSGKVSAAGTSAADANVDLLGFDMTASREFDAIQGALRFEGEYVSSTVGDTTYLPGNPDAMSFDNKRSGAYGQVAYRATKSGAAFLRNAELVTRYDWLDQPNASPQDSKLRRWTFGLDYWLGPSSVLKFAVDKFEVGDASSSSTFYLQIALGF